MPEENQKSSQKDRQPYGRKRKGWLSGRFRDDFKLFGRMPAKQESKATFWALIIIIAFAVAYVLSFYVR